MEVGSLNSFDAFLSILLSNMDTSSMNDMPRGGDPGGGGGTRPPSIF